MNRRPYTGWLHRQTDRQIDRLADRQSDSDRDDNQRRCGCRHIPLSNFVFIPLLCIHELSFSYFGYYYFYIFFDRVTVSAQLALFIGI